MIAYTLLISYLQITHKLMQFNTVQQRSTWGGTSSTKSQSVVLECKVHADRKTEQSDMELSLLVCCLLFSLPVCIYIFFSRQGNLCNREIAIHFAPQKTKRGSFTANEPNLLWWHKSQRWEATWKVIMGKLSVLYSLLMMEFFVYGFLTFMYHGCKWPLCQFAWIHN